MATRYKNSAHPFTASKAAFALMLLHAFYDVAHFLSLLSLFWLLSTVQSFRAAIAVTPFEKTLKGN